MTEQPDKTRDAAQDKPAAPETDEALRQKSVEYDALMDRFKRAAADYQNSLKRVERAMRERSDYAIEQFARELLPVADNLRRALNAAREHQTVEKIIEGIELVEKQLHDVFARHGIEPIAVGPGETFDPERHEAISVTDSGDQEPNKIVHEMQRGYHLRDRLLRPTQVVVSAHKPNEPPAPQATEPESPEDLEG